MMATITTKFSLGDTVWGLEHCEVSCEPERCPTCLGERRVDVRGEMYDCPKCNAKGTTQAKTSGFVVRLAGTIAHLDIDQEITTEDTCCGNWEEEPEIGEPYTRVRYWMHVRGGRTWDEQDLFATREIAQVACDERNGYVRAKGGVPQ